MSDLRERERERVNTPAPAGCFAPPGVAAAWHYAAQTAGFQIPNYETEGLEVGNLVIGDSD